MQVLLFCKILLNKENQEFEENFGMLRLSIITQIPWKMFFKYIFL